jgi:hypothetical protein
MSPTRAISIYYCLMTVRCKGITPSIIVIFMHLVKMAVAVYEHLAMNRKDKDSKFCFILIASPLRPVNVERSVSLSTILTAAMLNSRSYYMNELASALPCHYEKIVAECH